MKPAHSSGPIPSRIPVILPKSDRSRSIISRWGASRKAVAFSLALAFIPGRPYATPPSACARAASKAAKYPSVVSTRWPTMSRIVQPVHAVGASHAPGGSASVNSLSAYSRRTVRMVSLPA
jgi:hypothetical protein